jgi:mannosyltransferase
MKRLNALLEKYRHLPVFIIAARLYLINIDYSDLWNDEVFSNQLTTFSLPSMMELLAADLHPPHYFIALKVFATVAGSNAITLRLFSVIAVFATLLVVCTVGRRVLGRIAALYFCLMILTIPMVATYAILAGERNHRQSYDEGDGPDALVVNRPFLLH